MCPAVVGAETKNPNTFILANYGNLRTLDPCVAYDVTSSQRLWNIYEPLIFFRGPTRTNSNRFLPRKCLTWKTAVSPGMVEPTVSLYVRV